MLGVGIRGVKPFCTLDHSCIGSRHQRSHRDANNRCLLGNWALFDLLNPPPLKQKAGRVIDKRWSGLQVVSDTHRIPQGKKGDLSWKDVLGDYEAESLGQCDVRHCKC